MNRLRLAAVCALVFTSCAVPATSPVFSSRLDPQSGYVAERGAVSDPAAASVRDLALSLPVYESKDPGKNLTEDRCETSPAGDAWLLRGDGAQRPVAVKRLTPAGVNPVRLQVYLGASPGVTPADYGAIYHLEKVPGGWKVLSLKEGTADALFRWPME
jgi:hypothetical protein